MEWEASPAGDMIADAVVALIMHAQSSAASIRLTSKPCRHSPPTEDGEAPAAKKVKAEEDPTETRLRYLHKMLKEQYGDSVEAVYDAYSASYEIKLDTALESGVMDEDGMLAVTAKVEFEDDSGNHAKITVESKGFY